MMRRLAKFGGISTLVLVFLTLFSVVDIGSKARAAEFLKMGEARVTGRTWAEIMVLTAPLAIAVGVTLADYRPTGLLHTSWLAGNMVIYPGGLWAGIEYYVDGGKTGASDSSPGTSWEKPLLTIQAAINLTASGQGDRVFIAPKSTAYAEALSIAGKDYIGLYGIWSARYGWPDIAPASGVALTNNNSQGLILERLRLVGAGGSNAAVVQKANGFHFRHFVLEGAGDALQLLASNTDASDSYTASEGIIEDGWIRDSARGIRFKNPGPSGGVGGIGPTGVTVRRVTFVNITNEDVLDEDTAGSNDRTFFDCEILDCRHLDRNKAVYITLTNGGGNRGLISGCRFADDAGLNATKIALATGIVFSGNFQAAGMVDGSGF